jgi:hypothetical protein
MLRTDPVELMDQFGAQITCYINCDSIKVEDGVSFPCSDTTLFLLTYLFTRQNLAFPFQAQRRG